MAYPQSADQPSDQALSLGFFPIISTVALYKRFAPLRDYLAEQLHRPVALETAKNFPTFLRRTDERQYDIVVTAPHFALRAADSGKYRIRAALVGKVYQLLVVRKDSRLTSVKQLAGKRIATPPADALMTMVGMRELASAGLVGKRAPVYRVYVSHNAANQALLAGEVDAAIASSNVIRKALGKGAPFRVIKRSFKLPNMATLIATNLDPALANRVVQILVNMNKTAEGRQVLKQIRFPGYRGIKSAAEYESLRPFMQQATREMARKNSQLP
ncbi:MAG: phosphate/phosphite/phosphonate ABC transporter substrate-binding protein [Gammaproteobacteria bacterium]